MIFTLSIRSGNESLTTHPEETVANLLRTVAEQIENGNSAYTIIRDDNGNTVGQYELLDSDEKEGQ